MALTLRLLVVFATSLTQPKDSKVLISMRDAIDRGYQMTPKAPYNLEDPWYVINVKYLNCPDTMEMWPEDRLMTIEESD
jgi:hypothetical protein